MNRKEILKAKEKELSDEWHEKYDDCKSFDSKEVQIGVLDDVVILISKDGEANVNLRLTPKEAQKIGYALILSAVKVATQTKSDSAGKQ